MARFTHDVIVIGGGAGGLTSTVGCAQLGMKTALVEKKQLGGDCLYHGCVPSKTLLKTATVYQQAAEFERFGLPPLTLPEVRMSDVNARVHEVIAEIAKNDSAERFESLGAEVECIRCERDPTFGDDEKETILADLKESAMDVISRKGATQWGPATGVAHTVEAILNDTGEVLPCSVVLDGEFGHDDTAFGVPVKLGSDGVEAVVEWGLDDYETELMADAAEKLSDQYNRIA